MKIRFQGSYLFSALIIIIALWVFSRPLASIGLYVYNYTGAYMGGVYKKLVKTQEEASGLLIAQEKLQKVEEQNRILLLENTKLKSQANKNKDLKRQLKFKNKFSYNAVPAQIIGRSPDSWHKQIIINKGSVDGLKVGKAVLTEKSIVGKIARVNLENSIVQLIFDKNFQVGAKLKRTKLYGVLNGNYPGPATLDFITVGSDIKIGDKLVSSGINLDKKNPLYPENYPIGKVVEILRNPDALDLIVKVEINEDLRDLREVLVLK